MSKQGNTFPKCQKKSDRFGCDFEILIRYIYSNQTDMYSLKKAYILKKKKIEFKQ